MRDYDTIFFWLGGVLGKTISDLTFDQLCPERKGHESVRIKQDLRKFADQLSLGTKTPHEFCSAAASVAEKSLDPIKLEEEILRSARIDLPVLRILKVIPQTCSLWLVSDYPKEWFEAVYTRSDLLTIIPPERIVVTADSDLLELIPSVFYHLTWKSARPMEKCLLIDGNTPRAIEAMRHQLASIVYVYPERLIHELALQKILLLDADVMHPTSSERIAI